MEAINLTDEQSMEKELGTLQIKKFLGAANTCPSCKQKGNFGSILKYECEDGTEYLLCGWCGKTNKVKT